METRANYILIGVFTLLVIAGGFGFVWWFQRLSGSGNQVTYEVIYDGSVSGLRPGSAVLFNGIRVGEVSVVRLDTEDPRKVVALISVAATTPVRSDTKAGLELAGLTGVASVALVGGSPTTALLKSEAGKPPPRIVAGGSGVTDVMQGAKQVLERIDRLIETNEKKLEQILTDISVFTKDLAGKDGRSVAAEFADTAKSVTETAKSVRTLAESLERTVPATLQEYSLLAKDARRTAADISRAVRELEKNPSQLIWGRQQRAPAPAPTR
jgi:phospholipid/cholesterol/gamma-HCH transport system substrate-binding protein